MQVIDHRSLVAKLSAKQRAKLLERSDIAGLRHLAVHIGAIAVCTALIVLGVPFQPLVMLIQGILIVFLFTTLHETVHNTPFRSEYLNVWVGRICGFLIFLGPKWFQYFHLAHHRYTHAPGKDPELASPKPGTVWQYFKYLSGIPDLTDRICALFRNAIWKNHDEFVPRRGKNRVIKEARIQLALYVGLIGLSMWANSITLVFVWLLPILLGGPFLRAYLLAEHARCPHVASMLENTRTTYTNSLVRFLAWNMPYHVEHHSYPAVPFHKLPEFHKHINEHIVHIENGYLRFNKHYLMDSRTANFGAEV